MCINLKQTKCSRNILLNYNTKLFMKAGFRCIERCLIGKIINVFEILMS